MVLARALAAIALLASSARGDEVAPLDTIEDLHSAYFSIFKTGNRNAASHLWSSYILNKAGGMPAAKMTNIMRGFCAVSGSVIPDDPHTMYKTTLPTVTGGTKTGVVRHCCWPCICDMNEHVRVDTKTVALADGPRALDFLVVGDPCQKPEELSQPFVDPFSNKSYPLSAAASEVQCDEGGKLVGATFSDHGHPIIGMFFTDAESLDAAPEVPRPRSDAEHGAVEDPTFGYGEMCLMRKAQGYNSGMGLIFHLVAKISPIPGVSALPLPQPGPSFMAAMTQQVEEAPNVRLPPLGAELAKPGASGLLGLSALGVALLALVASLALVRIGRGCAQVRAQGQQPESVAE